MTFIEVTCPHPHFNKERRDLLANVLRVVAAKHLGTDVHTTQVTFAEMVVNGPLHLVRIKAEVFQDLSPSAMPERIVRNFFDPLNEFFYRNDMATAEIGCTVEWRNNYKAYWSSEMERAAQKVGA